MSGRVLPGVLSGVSACLVGPGRPSVRERAPVLSCLVEGRTPDVGTGRFARQIVRFTMRKRQIPMLQI
jgi:hypothetical protein